MRNDIYRYIFYSKEPVSKQQIANALNVSRPTVLQNLLELEEAGLVEMAEIRESQGGRPPAAYVAKGDIKMALGVSLSANQLKFLLSDLKQNVLAYKEIDLEYQTDSDVFAITEEQIEVFLTENHVDRKRLLGVGITIPGVFDENTKNIILSPTIKLKDFRIEEIRKKIPYPLYFENDGISGGVAEWLSRDAEEKKKDFVYLFLEEGVGGAIFSWARSLASVARLTSISSGLSAVFTSTETRLFMISAKPLETEAVIQFPSSSCRCSSPISTAMIIFS